MVPLGLEAKLYRNTGTYATPVWNEIPNVKDLTINLEKGEADVSTRGTGGWRQKRGTLKDANIEFQMHDDPDDADLTVLRDAFMDADVIDFVALNGAVATSGSNGLRALMEVFSFSRGEPLEEGLTIDVRLQPTYELTNVPSWFSVT